MNHIVKFQQENGLVADGIIGKNTLLKMRCVFGISTDAQLAHFLANVHHETGGFKADTENLNYSTAGLLRTFPKYFKTHAQALPYANKPEKIANKVYSNRMGNGSELSGDGWKYIGRGALQLTGKDNYRLFQIYINRNLFKGQVGKHDVVNNPELVADKYFWESALFYFTRNNLWNKMKGNTAHDVRLVRKAVNGGYNGLQHVNELFNYYYNLITK